MPTRGKTLGYTCLGCHGIETYKNVYPTYSVPKLRGQHAEYIVAALKEYRDSERGHATMHAHASTLSDQDMEDIAAYMSGGEVKTAGAEPVGKPPAAVATCQACHGRDGVGIMGMYPTLSGQHADYIEHSLNDYRKGVRKNAIMAPFAAQLKPEEIKEVAEYLRAAEAFADDRAAQREGAHRREVIASGSGPQRRDSSRLRNWATAGQVGIDIGLLAKPMAFVPRREIPDFSAAAADPRNHLFGFGVGHARIVQPLHHEQRLLDGGRVVQRRDALQEQPHVRVALVAVFHAAQVAAVAGGVGEETDEVADAHHVDAAGSRSP